MKEKPILRDFLKDDFFIKLVNSPDANTRHYWKSWLARHPERQEDFELAKHFVHSIKYKNPRKLSESDYNKLFTQIVKFKKLEDENDSYNILPKKRKLFAFIAWTAAIIIFLITFSFSVGYFIPDKKPVELSIHEELIEKISDYYDRYGIFETTVVTRSNKRANLYNKGIRNSILYREEEISKGDLLMVVKNNYYWASKNEELNFIANGDLAEIVSIHGFEELYGFR
ncbi:MAG: hypothetical protein L3J74_02970, partial [Bacteroidales bacterium]|nr:hypothetical protein [Bacteroidales bacterium]